MAVLPRHIHLHFSSLSLERSYWATRGSSAAI